MRLQDLRALALLTEILLRRLLREGLVVRSLVFPPLLAVGTMMLTIAVVAIAKSGPAAVALTDELMADQALVTAFHEQGMQVVADPDPALAVSEARVWAGTDGDTLWVFGGSTEAFAAEAVLRRSKNAAWVPEYKVIRDQGPKNVRRTRIIMVALSLLFALYGVVFGAGSVVRDRDEGTLESELSMPVPFWVHGAARWLAGSIAVCLFYAFGLALVDAVLGLPDSVSSLRHGIAACSTATAVGLFVAARAGANTGFSGPLAAGLTAVTSLLALGLAAPAFTRFIPLASLWTDTAGWEALAVAALSGVVATWTFSRRIEP